VKSSTRNWVFLGDSLTEGIGSERVSHVTELVAQLRLQRNGASSGNGVHHLRLRRVDPNGFDRFIKFNLAGYMNLENQDPSDSLWIWNLAAEGQTIETDLEWVPLMTAIKPDLVVIFRGSLESIIRPAMLHDGSWPWWVPRSWRGYAAMDPRCYFSSTSWRKAKQVAIDRIKSNIRLKLLQRRPGQPLMPLNVLESYYTELLKRVRNLDARILVLGLLPVDRTKFPDSPEYFLRVNSRLREVADNNGAEFCDWGEILSRESDHRELFFRDRFHPNASGAKALAAILQKHLYRRCASLQSQQ
jgi:lysophospholipase L1-like esterase